MLFFTSERHAELAGLPPGTLFVHRQRISGMVEWGSKISPVVPSKKSKQWKIYCFLQWFSYWNPHWVRGLKTLPRLMISGWSIPPPITDLLHPFAHARNIANLVNNVDTSAMSVIQYAVGILQAPLHRISGRNQFFVSQLYMCIEYTYVLHNIRTHTHIRVYICIYIYIYILYTNTYTYIYIYI